MDDTHLSPRRAADAATDARPPSPRGPRVGVAGVYYAIVGAFIVFALASVVRQIWFRADGALPTENCRAGLLGLVHAVERARAAAGTSPNDDEAIALHRFRGALVPEWQSYEAIAATCGRQTAWAGPLDLIQRLRYAEERATRRDAVELSPLRRRVDELVAKTLQMRP